MLLKSHTPVPELPFHGSRVYNLAICILFVLLQFLLICFYLLKKALNLQVGTRVHTLSLCFFKKQNKTVLIIPDIFASAFSPEVTSVMIPCTSFQLCFMLLARAFRSTRGYCFMYLKNVLTFCGILCSLNIVFQIYPR